MGHIKRAAEIIAAVHAASPTAAESAADLTLLFKNAAGIVR